MTKKVTKTAQKWPVMVNLTPKSNSMPKITLENSPRCCFWTKCFKMYFLEECIGIVRCIFSYPISVSWCFLSWSLVRSWWSFWSLLSTLLAFPEGYEPPGLTPMAWNISWAVIGEGPAPSLPSFSCLFAWHDGKILVIMIITEGLWSFKYRSEK